MLILLFLAVLLLTYSNGANDNFKGVATLWGSGTLQYKPALILATLTTLAGSVCSYFLAGELIKNFSGKGLVPDEIIQSVDFVLAVALAAGTTVLLATKLGFPVSTTHGLVGALVGAGLVAAGNTVNFSKLGSAYFMPLVLGPVLAIAIAALLYAILKRARIATGITEESCVCVGNNQWVPVAEISTSNFVALKTTEVKIDSTANCINQYQGKFIGLPFQSFLNVLHYISAGVVSFARGLNDTPKLVSLMLLCNFFPMQVNIFILAIAMALGGLLNAKRIAETMSKKITKMNHGQGFTANLVTGFLVITASKFGLPVSTTHVSVGSIFGIGLVNRTANTKEISKIGLSWLLTLPIAGALSALYYFIIHTINK